MGNTAISAQKCIFVKYKGHVYTVPFPNNVTREVLTEIIKYRTHTRDSFKIALKNTEGTIVIIDSEMKLNTYRAPYILETYDSNVYGMDLRQDLVVKKEDEDDLRKCIRELKDLKQIMMDISVRTNQNEISKPTSMNNFSIYPMYILSSETITHLKTPTFKIWQWEQNQMLSILEFMFEDLGLIAEFKMERTTLKKWLMCIQSNYRNNPFHNFRHCFCVAQMMYGLIHLCELNKLMTRVELGILLVAAICHDLDHPGFNNTYQINARTELAIRYNDISPLENHHCAVTFQILANPSCNIFANVSNETYKQIRVEIVKLILATDMARHKEVINKFENNTASFDYKNDEHMDSLKMILLKCCDISNEVRPFDVSEPWVDCLLEEYFLQSDREKKEGLPVTNFMDREQVTKSNAQLVFIKTILLPMFESLLMLFPQIKEPIIQPLIEAFMRYEKMKNAEDQEKK